jgi:hypothetical protein
MKPELNNRVYLLKILKFFNNTRNITSYKQDRLTISLAFWSNAGFWNGLIHSEAESSAHAIPRLSCNPSVHYRQSRTWGWASRAQRWGGTPNRLRNFAKNFNNTFSFLTKRSKMWIALCCVCLILRFYIVLYWHLTLNFNNHDAFPCTWSWEITLLNYHELILACMIVNDATVTDW